MPLSLIDKIDNAILRRNSEQNSSRLTNVPKEIRQKMSTNLIFVVGMICLMANEGKSEYN